MAQARRGRYASGPVTLEEYDEMIARGHLTAEDRVELLEGEIVTMAPIGDPHAAAVMYLTRWFVQAAGMMGLVSAQSGLKVPPSSRPEPDVVVAVPRADFYARGGIHPENVLLLIEVSDTTFTLDSGRKSRLYARAGIAEYWIVDLPRRRIVRHLHAVADSWSEVRSFGGSDEIEPSRLPGVRFPVGALMVVFGEEGG